MITMNELVDLRMQQHIAHEIYRQQIMQRIPDPFPPMLPIPMPRHVLMPPRITLPGVEATLQNDDLWKQFHQIGTEMIITKSGRRMFPSMRLSLSGLQDESNYCVLLEMVPIGDCRYKFSGSQWVPAGGAEPQSPQRMYLHPDSPAMGAHWQAQPILFNKVKLTNNTLDNNGHIVLASMHKYQPRLHVIRTSDLSQIPWAPQQAFVFPETEFVAVTAYQNDRITKLKIDNNPFAKGFRETGQSRCKRKMSSSPLLHEDQDQPQQEQSLNDMSPTNSMTKPNIDAAATTTTAIAICNDKNTQQQQRLQSDSEDGPRIKRIRSNGSTCSITSFDDAVVGGISGGDFCSGNSSSGTSSPNDLAHENANPPQQASTTPAILAHPSHMHLVEGPSLPNSATFMHHFQQNMQSLLRPSLVDLACSYFGRPQPLYPQQSHIYANAAAAAAFAGSNHHHQQHHLQHQHTGFNDSIAMHLQDQLSPLPSMEAMSALSSAAQTPLVDGLLSPTLCGMPNGIMRETLSVSPPRPEQLLTRSPPKKKGFSISAILDSNG